MPIDNRSAVGLGKMRKVVTVVVSVFFTTSSRQPSISLQLCPCFTLKWPLSLHQHSANCQTSTLTDTACHSITVSTTHYVNVQFDILYGTKRFQSRHICLSKEMAFGCALYMYTMLHTLTADPIPTLQSAKAISFRVVLIMKIDCFRVRIVWQGPRTRSKPVWFVPVCIISAKNLRRSRHFMTLKLLPAYFIIIT